MGATCTHYVPYKNIYPQYSWLAHPIYDHAYICMNLLLLSRSFSEEKPKQLNELISIIPITSITVWYTFRSHKSYIL